MKSSYMLRRILSLVLLVGSGCSEAQIYQQNPLSDQILKPRPGHEGKLTNRACLKFDDDKCVDEKIAEYDLKDAEFRDRVNKMNFICNLGGRRFKICKDKPGFCRFYRQKKCFLGICVDDKKLTEEYIPVEPYSFILDAKTRCFQKDLYPFEGP